MIARGWLSLGIAEHRADRLDDDLGLMRRHLVPTLFREHLATARHAGREVCLLLRPQPIEELGIPTWRPAVRPACGDDDERYRRELRLGLHLVEAGEQVDAFTVLRHHLTIFGDLLRRQVRLDLLDLVGMVRLHQHQAGDVVGVVRRVELRGQAAERDPTNT